MSKYKYIKIYIYKQVYKYKDTKFGDICGLGVVQLMIMSFILNYWSF